MDLKELLRMNLQMFAEPEGGDGSNPGEPEQPTDPNKLADEPKDKPEAKYTDEDVDKIINEKFAKWQEKQAEKIAEAEKLAKMNAEQKKQYEYEKLQQELEKYRKKDQYYSLSKEASKMLSENDIQADDDLLQLVVKDTAEDTQKAVNSFVSLFNAKVEEGVKKALSGTAPKVNTQPNKTLDKEGFNKLSYTERVELKKTNPELYNQLTKGE